MRSLAKRYAIMSATERRAVNPKLKPAQLIDVIVGTAERSADGRRNLVDPKKARAAVQAAGGR